jgi:hypothetical protein
VSLRAETRLQWRDPLPPSALDAVARARPGGASIRLYGAACSQIDEVLERIPVRRLAVDARRVRAVSGGTNTVVELALEGVPENDAVLRAFGSVQTLRVDAHGAAFDVRLLTGTTQLRRLSIAAASLSNVECLEQLDVLAALEVSHCTLEGGAGALLRHPRVEALRLAATAGVRSLRAISGNAALRALELDRLLHLDSLAPLQTLESLESLALRGLWQFNVHDAAFICGMKGLRRLAIDIGGRRKNVEIRKRLPLPEPDAFDVGDYDLTTSYDSGVQRIPPYLSSVTTIGAVAGFCAENGGV